MENKKTLRGYVANNDAKVGRRASSAPRYSIDWEKLRDAAEAVSLERKKTISNICSDAAISRSTIRRAIDTEMVTDKAIGIIESAFGIPAEVYVNDPDYYRTAPKREELPLPDPEEKKAADEDLRREIRKIRDDLADLGILLNAIREDRNRADEKILQILGRINDKQLTQKQLGEEIVGGLIIAAGQINIDEPTKSAYTAIRKGLKKDIYLAIKGDLK